MLDLDEDAAMDADRLVGEDPGSPSQQPGGERAWAAAVLEPVRWVRMLCRELGATFVAGVVLVYGLSQGFAGSFFRVASDYYWKDVQRVQPATVQFLSVFFYVPWVLKPLWGGNDRRLPRPRVPPPPVLALLRSATRPGIHLQR